MISNDIKSLEQKMTQDQNLNYYIPSDIHSLSVYLSVEREITDKHLSLLFDSLVDLRHLYLEHHRRSTKYELISLVKFIVEKKEQKESNNGSFITFLLLFFVIFFTNMANLYKISSLSNKTSL